MFCLRIESRRDVVLHWACEEDHDFFWEEFAAGSSAGFEGLAQCFAPRIQAGEMASENAELGCACGVLESENEGDVTGED